MTGAVVFVNCILTKSASSNSESVISNVLNAKLTDVSSKSTL